MRHIFVCTFQNGNIAELLLREGFAKCVDWSLAIVTDGPEQLRAAEKLVFKYVFSDFFINIFYFHNFGIILNFSFII